MRHLIDPLDFTKEETQKLLDLADRIHDDPEAYQDVADHKRLATLFYEPSTRTRLSFESAMLRLGGKVLGFPDAGVFGAGRGCFRHAAGQPGLLVRLALLPDAARHER